MSSPSSTPATLPPDPSDALLTRLLGEGYETRHDTFDLVQLREVVSVCGRCRTLSEAGRELFAVSRLRKSTANDADRLARYLRRFGLRFEDLHA